MIDRDPAHPWLVGDEPTLDPIWIIEHELPPLPSGFELEIPTPVARWVDLEVAAVLWVTRREDEEDGSDVDTDTDIAFRTGEGWQTCSGSGGASWWWGPDEPPFVRRKSAIDFESAIWFGGPLTVGEKGRRYRAVDGFVAEGVAAIEVEHANGTQTRRNVESPFGCVVVATAEGAPATARAIGYDERVLGTTTF